MGKQERGKSCFQTEALGLSKEGPGEHRREFRSLGTNLENRVSQLKHLGRAGRRIGTSNEEMMDSSANFDLVRSFLCGFLFR